MIRNLKLFLKFVLLALMIPATVIIIAVNALNKTNTLKYEYDNLYGFMLIPLLEVDKGNLHREKLNFKLLEFTQPNLSPQERTAIAKAIRVEDKMMTDFIAQYESEWLTTLSPEFTVTLATLGQQHLQTIEAETLAQFHQVYDAYVPKRDAFLADKMVEFNRLRSDLEQMENTFDSLVQVNRQFADYSNESAQNAIAYMRWTLVISGGLLSLFALGLAWWLAHLIAKPVALLSRATQQLAQGNLDIKSVITSHKMEQITIRQDEIGEIGRAFDDLARYFKTVIEDIVQMSQGLASDNLTVTPQSEYRGDFLQIKTALETATVKLAEVTQKTAAQDWLKTGQTQLNALMSGEQEIVALAKHIISFLTTYVEAQVGLFYLLQESNSTATVKLIASYAYTYSDIRPTEFLLGEGLVGEVALERKMISVTQTPEECASIIRSGLANTLPKHVLLLPFLYENTVKGIIEIGATKALTNIQQEFLTQMMPSIGIAVNTAESRTKMQELLQTSQKQTEILQTQSEQLHLQQDNLQQINEDLENQRQQLQTKQKELQQQNEELQVQSEELQTQQEELRQTNEALEERTNELEQQKDEMRQKNVALEKNQQIIEAKAQELELANQYKSEFLANMSHELRTPLNSLLILAQLLANNKEGHLNNKQVEYAQTIHNAGTDLLRLINDILDLSKVEAGKMEIHVEEVSLADLVEAIEQKFRPVANQKELAFHITMAENLPPVFCTDIQRIQQIINNLLSNAFKFTNKGEIQLIIQRPNPDNIPLKEFDIAKTIAFSIHDTGIGIPKEKQQLIFEAFQQVDGTTSRSYGGTGLGLSISRQLARLLGGEIQVDCEEGKGCTFTLYLPETKISVSSQAGNLPATPIISGETVTQIISTSEFPTMAIADDRTALQPNDKSLLIIEDDHKFVTLLKELAQEKDFKCLIAEDGQTGLQLAEQYQPTAIILDVSLPNLDGWNVMDRLKDNTNTRHIPVHFISATEQNGHAKQMGAIGYLLKPVNIEQLGEAFQKIEQFISKTVKDLLIIADDEIRQNQILELAENKQVHATVATTKVGALKYLKQTEFDCIILDLNIEQNSGVELLEDMKQIEELCQTPLIVYTERELTHPEKTLLLQCADHLTLKTVNSPERLLDETTLFLHQLATNLSNTHQQMLRMVHNKTAIFTHKKVLIADDDIRNVFALTNILEEKDMDVVVGNTGKEALKLLAEHPDIAIVLMDIMMPEMDGYEAMQEIRKQSQYRNLPIIALTAKAMKGDKTKCIEAGANDYLSKPVETEKLISLMRVWLYH